MKTDTAPQLTDKPKIPLPTLAQINADRITQVSEHSIEFLTSCHETSII